MVMIGKFLKEKNLLHDENSVVRRDAIRQLDPEKASELQAELADLAQHDSDTLVRIACVEKLDDPDFLGTLITEDTMTRAVATQIAKLINAGAICDLGNHPGVLSL